MFKEFTILSKNKSPGSDGLTVEFYIAFWRAVGDLLVDSLNYSYDYGELSNSEKREKFSNWRPISLINVDAKIGSKAIALRLQAILPSMVHLSARHFRI